MSIKYSLTHFFKFVKSTLDPRGIAPRRLLLTSKASNYSGPKAVSLYHWTFGVLNLFVIWCLIFGALPVPKARAAAPINGLVGYWNMDEGSGTTAGDSSGNGNNGTLAGGLSWSTGQVGGALQFSGAGYISVPNSSVLSGSPDLTVSMWVNTSDTASRTILSKRHSASPYYSYSITVDTLTNNRATCTVLNSSETNAVAGGAASSFARGVWQHIACVYDGTSVRVYTNGTQNGFTANLTGTVFASDSVLYAPMSNSAFSGSLDEVRIYNRALSPAEVLDVYNDMGSTSARATSTFDGTPAISCVRMFRIWD